MVVLSLTGPQQGSPRAVPVHLFFFFVKKFINLYKHYFTQSFIKKSFTMKSVIKPCNVHQRIPARHTHGV